MKAVSVVGTELDRLTSVPETREQAPVNQWQLIICESSPDEHWKAAVTALLHWHTEELTPPLCYVTLTPLLDRGVHADVPSTEIIVLLHNEHYTIFTYACEQMWNSL